MCFSVPVRGSPATSETTHPRQMVKESVAHLRERRSLAAVSRGHPHHPRADQFLGRQRGTDRKTCQRAGANPGDRNRFALLEQGLAAVPAAPHCPSPTGCGWASGSTRPRTSRPLPPNSTAYYRRANSRAHCSRAGSSAMTTWHAEPCAARSDTHLVLIPSYNPGPQGVFDRARRARAVGSRLGGGRRQHRSICGAAARRWPRRNPACEVFVLPGESRQGRRRAVRTARGADPGVHPCTDHGFRRPAPRRADSRASCKRPWPIPTPWCSGSRYSMPARPDCGSRAAKFPIGGPISRPCGRGIHDSLFGFRVYPIEPLISVMRRQPWMRRFDFDVEAVVRLCWRGVRPINLPAPVRYFRPEEGGVSHFNYWRDNVLLTWMHFRLFCGFVCACRCCYCGARAAPALSTRSGL